MPKKKVLYRIRQTGVNVKSKDFPHDTVWDLAREGWTANDIGVALGSGIIVIEEEVVEQGKAMKDEPTIEEVKSESEVKEDG